MGPTAVKNANMLILKWNLLEKDTPRFGDRLKFEPVLTILDFPEAIPPRLQIAQIAFLRNCFVSVIFMAVYSRHAYTGCINLSLDNLLVCNQHQNTDHNVPSVFFRAPV